MPVCTCHKLKRNSVPSTWVCTKRTFNRETALFCSPKESSKVACIQCGNSWLSKANYVFQLKYMDVKEFYVEHNKYLLENSTLQEVVIYLLRGDNVDTESVQILGNIPPQKLVLKDGRYNAFRFRVVFVGRASGFVECYVPFDMNIEQAAKIIKKNAEKFRNDVGRWAKEIEVKDVRTLV